MKNFKSVSVAFPLMASATIDPVKNVYYEGSSDTKPSQVGEYGFEYCRAGGEVETYDGVVDGRTYIVAGDDHSFVKVIWQLLLEKRNGARG